MNGLLAKPLFTTVAALIVCAIAGVIIVPQIGNAPAVPAALEQQVVSTTTTNVSAAATGSAVQLAFPVGGRIGSVNVTVGDKVAKGQILATLDLSVASAAVAQAKAALDLAQAQFGAANLQYANAKTQQDTLVANAYHTLLSSGLEARPEGTNDESHNPIISGTYVCSKTGAYEIETYASGAASNYSFRAHGLEEGEGPVTYGTPVPLGSCGLSITFQSGFSGGTKWTVDVPNTHSSSYQANKNAYDLAVVTRGQTLSQLAASIGQAGAAPNAAVTSAAVSVAKAAYDAALAQYDNDLITAPNDGTVTYVDTSLKPGQAVSAAQRVLTVTSN